MTAKIVTANRLRDGEVVYLAADAAWSEDLGDSALAETPEREAELLAAAETAVEARLVVGPYLMPVRGGSEGPLPLSQREVIRARGPSVRPDLGKQAIGR